LLYKLLTIVWAGPSATSEGGTEALRMCRERMLARRVVLEETSAGTAAKASLLGAVRVTEIDNQVICQQSMRSDKLQLRTRDERYSPSKVLLLPCNCPNSAAPSVVLATDWAASASEVKLAAVRAAITCCSRQKSKRIGSSPMARMRKRKRMNFG
jgi:hypothetical protein